MMAPAANDVGIGGEHDGGHRAAGRETGDEHAATVDPVIDDHFLDHVADRHRLASPALDVAGAKPVEAVFRIVRALLLRQQEHEAVAIGERRPAGAEIVARRRLRTAVQDDHQRRLRVRRHVFEHAQRAGIGAESCAPRSDGRTRGRNRARTTACEASSAAGFPTGGAAGRGWLWWFQDWAS